MKYCPCGAPVAAITLMLLALATAVGLWWGVVVALR
jgi:hypothetical protein